MNNQWQPIETAPKDGTKILLVLEGIHPHLDVPYTPSIGWFNGVVWGDEESEYSNCESWSPTHWMQLPKNPCEYEKE